jgi:NAD(P)-dependent dehydrogenase (short-subunit alcohol dehydrogenase family)
VEIRHGPTGRMANKLVVVTGSGSGIGQAVVQRMLDEGASVAALDINAESLRTWDEASSAGRPVRTFVVDVSIRSEVEAQVGAAIGWLRGCDALINVAGITTWNDPLEITEEEWDRVMDVNAKGTFLCSQVAGRTMRERGGGSIVNVSSIATELVVAHQAHYAASKGAVRSLTKGLAVGLAPFNIRVNAVSPGPTLTPMARRELSRDPAHTERMLGRVLRGRPGEPTDIAATILFLASDESDFITGTTLYADGGVTATR